MEPKVKIWVEKGGGVALSGYRVRLLKLVADTGSLAEAARRMGLSYRRAWGKIREMEENLGLRLVESEPGGPGGGRSRLTSQARKMVELYPLFEAAATADVNREFDEILRRQG
jgi:molybdate transport system regulatory protein